MRVSTNDGYLEPARGRPNLQIVGHAVVSKFKFEGNRPHVSGVHVEVGGQSFAPRATREVILSAGAIHSPAVLQRSGIGPAVFLKSLGISVIADLPVGENLLDHPIIPLYLHLKDEVRVSTLMHRHTNCCLRYASGLGGAGENDMIVIAGNLVSLGGGDTSKGRMALSVYQAFSQGQVRIATTDPGTDPRIDERMLSDERDLVRMRDGIRRLRDLGRHDSVRAITTRVEYGMTGRSIEDVLSAEELDHWLFDECSDAQHASGTCRMGPREAKTSVVDIDCRVIGVSGLRVIDASIMPEVVRANTHLTTVMMAEKMADKLKAAK